MPLLFGDCLFDTERRLLARSGQEVHLTPKAFQLLELLVERRPRPIAKTEILTALWPDAAVAEGSLSNLVAEVRDALGESARGSRYVRTFHRFGYAFCAEVVEAPSFEMPVPLRPRCRLETAHGPVLLREGDSTIGRDEECEVWIPSTTVSRRHARIRLADGEARLEDLGSKNGTFLREQKIEGPTPLADGDPIQVGAVRLVFRVSSDTKTTDSLILPSHR